GWAYRFYRKAFTKHSDVKLLLWEANREYCLIAPYVAKDFQFKVLAVPHNIEALVPGNTDPFTGKSFPLSLENELKCLSQADSVFCISREEQWLLRSYGIEADFLPYYPPKSILSELLEFRRIRDGLIANRFLILGTAYNPPTYLGMIQQIQLLNQINKNVDFHIDIAGYGTEQLKEYCDGPNFTLHGTVDQGKLNYLLSNVKAILVHQKAGAGALTRIPEMLIAGVPIIANSNACRSAFDYPGVYCYDNQVELAALVNKSLDFPPILERPVAAERRFIDCFKHLVSHSTESQFKTAFDSSVHAISGKLSSARSHEAKLSGDRP
ncbi:MAG: hypothetical protein ACREPR_14555, partial [Brasilonema sp.]